MRISVKCDISRAMMKLATLTTVTKSATPDSMRRAVEELREDARDKVPKCPRRSGNMYDRHFVYVNVVPGRVVGTLKVDTPYAFAVHEGVVGKTHAAVQHWTRPGSGPHWVLAKVVMFRGKYVRLISDGIKVAIKRTNK